MNKYCFLLIIIFSTIILSKLFISVQEGMINIPEKINEELYSFKRCSGNNNQHTKLFCNHTPIEQWRGKFCNCINNKIGRRSKFFGGKCDCDNNSFPKYKHHFINNYSLTDNKFDNLRLYY